MSSEQDLFRQRVKNMVVIPKEIYDKCLSHWDASIRDAANSINIRQMNNFCTNKDDKTDLTKKVNIKYIDKDGVGTGQVNVQDDKPRVSNKKVQKKSVVDVSTQTPIPYVDASTQTPSDQSVKENIGTQSSQDDAQNIQTVQDATGTQSSQSVQNEGISTGTDFSQEEKNARIEADNIATDRLLDEEEFDRQQQQELQKSTVIESDNIPPDRLQEFDAPQPDNIPPDRLQEFDAQQQQELQKLNVNTYDISTQPIYDFQLPSDDDDDDDDIITALSDRESILQEIAPKLVSDQFENTKWEKLPEPTLSKSETDYLSKQHSEKLKKDTEKFKANLNMKYKMRQRQKAKRSERYNRQRFKSLSPVPEESTTNESPQKEVNTEINTDVNTEVNTVKDQHHDEALNMQENVATIPTQKVVMSKQHLKKNKKDNEKYNKLRQHQRAKRNDRFNSQRLKSISSPQEDGNIDIDQEHDEVLSDLQPNVGTVPTEDDNLNLLDLETNVSTLRTEVDSPLLDSESNISTVRTKGVESNTPEPVNNKYNQLKERIKLLKQQYIKTFNSYNALPLYTATRPKKFMLKKKLIRLDRLLKNAVDQLDKKTNNHKFNRLEKKVPIVLKRIKRRNILPINKKVKEREEKNSVKINSEEKKYNKGNSRGQKRKAKSQIVGLQNQFNNKRFKKKKEFVKKNKKKGKMKVKKGKTIKGKSTTKLTPTKTTARSKKKSIKKDVSQTIKGTPTELIPTKVTTRSKGKNANKDKIVKVDKDVPQISDLKNITSKPDLNAGHLADYTNLSRKSRKKNKILEDEDEERSQKSRGVKRKAEKQPFGFQFQATKKRNIHT